MEWATLAKRAERRYREGEKRVPERGDARQKQLVRIANAAYAAGLAWLMGGNQADARGWLGRAAKSYKDSHEFAPPGSWGRPIGAVKARLIADDWDGAGADAQWSLQLGSAQANSPIGRYAAALALLVVGEDASARPLAEGLRAELPEEFPAEVADTLIGLAGADPKSYGVGVRAVLTSFESRDTYLEDVPVADTVIALETLAEQRQMAVRPSSPLLPPG